MGNVIQKLENEEEMEGQVMSKENLKRLQVIRQNHPLLMDLIVMRLAEYLDWETLRNGREVCSIWCEHFSSKFWHLSRINADFTSRKSKAEFLQMYPKLTKTDALHLTPGSYVKHGSISKWISKQSTFLTRLTLGSDDLSLPYFPIYLGEFYIVLNQCCKTIKYLTLINARVIHLNFKLLDVAANYLFPTRSPKLSLTMLSIISKKELSPKEENCNPFVIAPFMFSMIVAIQTLKLEYNASSGNDKVFRVDNGATERIFKSMSCMLFENTADNEQENTHTLDIMHGRPFYNLGSFSIKGRDNVIWEPSTPYTRRFNHLRQLGFAVHDFPLKFARHFCNLRQLYIHFSHINPSMYDYSLNLKEHCPNLNALFLRDVEHTSDQRWKLLSVLAHPTARVLKIDVKEVDLSDLANEFPNLETLWVNLCDKDLDVDFGILSQHHSLKKLSMKVNAENQDFENAMKKHVNSFLQSIQDMNLMSTNKNQIEDLDLFQIFPKEIVRSKAALRTLDSVVLSGFKISKEQCAMVRDYSPFDLHIL